MKRLLSLIIIFGITICFLEIALSLYYFQRQNDDHVFATIHYLTLAERRLTQPRPAPIGIWRRDSKFGYSHVPNTSGVHRTPDFEATYTIGGSGERYSRSPSKPVGKILFLGGSYTFGHGVQNDENFPSILGKYWPNWQIVNGAVMGWGTSHAYMKLSDKLEDEDPPSIIIYTMIPHHVRRNYILKEWVERLNQFDRGHPHFELINGEPVFQGIIDVSDGAEDVPSTRQIELSLTSAFLDQMRTKAKQAKIRFVVIFLEALPPYEVIRGLVKNDVSVLDLTSLELEGFAGDQHPNPQDHERIAEAISRSFVAQILSDQ